MIRLDLLDKEEGIAWAQAIVRLHHYLRRPVDSRCSVEGYAIYLSDAALYAHGVLLFGRPEATRCYPWYGGVEDVASGRAECSRWGVLNLARVWLDPSTQPGGALYQPEILPGFRDRRGAWRSTLASTALLEAARKIRLDYLLQRPPCFLEEPYQLRWLLSYCDTRLHKGTIYKAAGFELYRTNARGMQTWRLPLEPLSPAEDRQVRTASALSPRSREYRDLRDAGRLEQLSLLGGAS